MGSNDCGGASFDVPRQYGVTKPLSTAGPTEADLQRNMELEKLLADSGLYESKEGVVLREEVLGQLDQFMYHLLKSTKPISFKEDIFAFWGFYLLENQNKVNSDIYDHADYMKICFSY